MNWLILALSLTVLAVRAWWAWRHGISHDCPRDVPPTFTGPEAWAAHGEAFRAAIEESDP